MKSTGKENGNNDVTSDTFDFILIKCTDSHDCF